jgi:nucleotide-binding universal stress UspA family protein
MSPTSTSSPITIGRVNCHVADVHRHAVSSAPAHGAGVAALSIHSQLVRGQGPAAEVVDLAEEVGAELLVTGDSSPDRRRKFLLGSTAERILLDTGCALLSVKAVDGP